tara:strand:+ start:49 stop:369 length:321 start_codon:yes stop_codon:yes gene_type:complete
MGSKSNSRSTVITARHNTACPRCGGTVKVGMSSKVYANKWYHIGCWEVTWQKILNDRESKARLEAIATQLDVVRKAILDGKLNGLTIDKIQTLQQTFDDLIEGRSK